MLCILFMWYRLHTEEKRQAAFLLEHHCSRDDHYNGERWYRCDNGVWQDTDIDLLIKN
jgi:hypothetical protein